MAGAVAKCGRAHVGKRKTRLRVTDSVFNAAFQWIGFFCFVRMHLSRALQFFQDHDVNSALLPFPDSSILIYTTFPRRRHVLLSKLAAEENREVQDG